MREDFQAELDRVGSTLVTMAMAARETMRQASNALITSDHAVAQQVTDRDAEIYVLYRVAEDRAYDLVTRRQPIADDLRKAVTSIQVAADLRRMGGLAVHVARSVLRRHPEPAIVPELAELFQSMGTVADGLAGKIVSALSDHDAVLAAQLDRDDDAMDHLHQRLFAVLVSPDWPMGIEAAIDGALLGRYYERYADNAVNVGHHVVALLTGKSD